MKKNILLLITTAILMINGCADKKSIATADGKNGSNARVFGNRTEIYRNDNRTYNNRTFSTTNGEYADLDVKNIYFDANQYNITSDKLPIIYSNANALRSKVNTGSKLKVEGHCDASGSDEYNYALGLRRAKSAKDALINKGINADNILIVSMGESSPECYTSSSASCYAKNRRVEFKIEP